MSAISGMRCNPRPSWTVAQRSKSSEGQRQVAGRDHYRRPCPGRAATLAYPRLHGGRVREAAGEVGTTQAHSASCLFDMLWHSSRHDAAPSQRSRPRCTVKMLRGVSG